MSLRPEGGVIPLFGGPVPLMGQSIVTLFSGGGHDALNCGNVRRWDPGAAGEHWAPQEPISTTARRVCVTRRAWFAAQPP